MALGKVGDTQVGGQHATGVHTPTRSTEKPRLGRGLAALIPGGGAAYGHVAPESRDEGSAAPEHDRSSVIVSSEFKGDSPAASGLGVAVGQSAPALDSGADAVVRLRLTEIVPNTMQPRATFDDSALAELADSLQAHGVLQPVLVRPRPGGGYELIAGERRFRAARLAGLQKIPAIVRETSDNDSLAIALIENVQREDLNAIEAARGYRMLLDRFDITQSELARQIGKAQPTIANALRLLRLPDPIQDTIAEGRISEEHGKALLTLSNEEDQRRLWQLVLQKSLTVAETRRLALDMARGGAVAVAAPKAEPVRSVHWSAIEDRLRSALGYKVGIKPGAKGGATVTIELASDDDIDELLGRLGAA